MPTKRLDPKGAWLAPGVSSLPGEQRDSARWAELTDSPLFRQACERALAECSMRNKAGDMAQAAMVGLRMEGAKQVLEILLNLGEPDRPTMSKGEDQLVAPEALLAKLR